MKIVPAKAFDIPEIMKIERSAFIPSIQENQKTFEERLLTFPEGFFLLQDASDETVLKEGHAVTAGYFCSELWSAFPDNDDIFKLGHSSSKVHDYNGPFLYATSFALYPHFRGQKLARPFFYDSLCSVCGAFPSVKKVLLLVNEEWKGARHIYESLGFVEERILPDFFPALHNSHSAGILMSASAELFRQAK